jgi:hypothetical protein
MDSPTTSTGHVFISYAREDQTYARKLADSLRKRGLETWMDDRIDPAQRWWSTIVQALRDCIAFVVVMTPDAGESIWVSKEIHLALEERKPLFPLLLRGQRFPICVDLQCADVTSGRMPPDEFYERLEREVRAQLEEDPVAPLAPGPAVRKKQIWSWSLLGLLALVIGVVVSGLVGGGEEPALVPTTSVPVMAEKPTHTPRPATATSIPAPVVVDTPSPTLTSSPTATSLPTATDTPSPTLTSSPTVTSLPTATDTPPPTPTSSPTATSLPTATGTPPPTPTSSLTATNLPTATDTSTPPPSPTATSPPTATLSLTLTPQPPTPTPTLGIGSPMVYEKDGMEMVYVPGGTFQMGYTDGYDDEQLVHMVMLHSFWVDRTEATNSQYARCVCAGVGG